MPHKNERYADMFPFFDDSQATHTHFLPFARMRDQTEMTDQTETRIVIKYKLFPAITSMRGLCSLQIN